MNPDPWLFPAQILNLSAMTLVFALAWLVMRRHPRPYFRWWVISSGISALGNVVSLIYLQVAAHPLIGMAIPAIAAANSAALITCARRFRGDARPAPAKWWAAGALALSAWAMALAGAPMPVYIALPFMAMMASYLWFGWVFWPRRGDVPSSGARMVSLCAIAWGLHVVTYPTYEVFFPALLGLGFWISGMLQAGLGVAMIVHLFELSHDREQALTQQLNQTNQELLRTLSALTDSRSQAETSEAIAREREALVRQVIHDLRNATQAISLISEDIEAAAGDKSRVEQGVAALDRQVRFISNFLKEKLAWIVDRTVDSDQTALPASFESLSALFQPILGAKAQTMVIEPPPDVAVHITPVQFEQIAGNLIRNAHAHCPPGTHIRVWTAVSDGWVTCYVADDGPGIPLSAQAQLGRGPARSDGTGVGLRNVQELATQAGGLFGLVSAEGAGSTFYVTLPLISWGLTVPGTAPRPAIR